MSTNLNPPATCPNCAQPLPASAPAGLCPACLLAQGLDTDPGGKPGRFQPPPVEEIARLFPQLEILGLLGAGGMGAVYKARQPALDRLVAIKVLPPQGAGGADSAERFNREARALARLSHPNIVAVHEFGLARAGDFQSPSPETPDARPQTLFPYFIMEFVDGANLRQLGRAARLSPREALQIIPQICDALQYAHDEGVVHRDIKPENVLVDRKGRVKIADFGLAKIFGPDSDAFRLTAEGQVMGTPHYMAPEQVERPLAVDHRADIYSLGVVFYELLTGDLPLGKFAPPSRKVSVDVRLDDVVLRALENDPASRYQRASEVKSQVANITSSAATQPTPSRSRREEVPAGGSRTWWLKFAIVVCVLLSTAAAVLMTMRWRFIASRHQKVPLLVAKLDPATGILRANVPGRGFIELLGVAETNAAPNQWWWPDGRVATNTNYELHNLVESSRDSGHFRVFVFRAHDLPEGADGPFLASAEPGAMMSSGGTVFSHGKPLAGGRPMVLALREPRRFTAIRVGLAIEARRAVFSYDPATRRTQHFSQPGDPRWGVSLHGATDTPGGSQVTSVMPRVSTDWQVQLIAVDQAGKERTHRMASGAGTPSGGDQLWTYNFPGLPLKDVKEFRVVVRRVQQFEFPDVVLEPKGKLPEAKPLRFSEITHQFAPAWEHGNQAFEEKWLDLDSKRTGSLRGGAQGNVPAWARTNGFDVALGKESLLVSDTEFAPVKDSDFDVLTPQQVIDSVYRGRFAPRELNPPNSEGSPVTFTFETREGGFGILEFTRNMNSGKPSGIRFKRVER